MRGFIRRHVSYANSLGLHAIDLVGRPTPDRRAVVRDAAGAAIKVSKRGAGAVLRRVLDVGPADDTVLDLLRRRDHLAGSKRAATKRQDVIATVDSAVKVSS